MKKQLGLLALGAAGVTALTVYFWPSASGPGSAGPRSEAPGPETFPRNPSPGPLPGIALGEHPEVAHPEVAGTAVGAVAPASLPTADQLAALQLRLAEMESRLAAVASAPPRVNPFPPGVDAPIPPSKPPPTILPGTENNPDGPLLYDPGPPWPYNEGARGLDPPHVPGAGCLTCESGTAGAAKEE